MEKQLFCDGWLYEGRLITLPHDAMLEAGRSPDSSGGSAVGYFNPCICKYEKHFEKPDAEHAELLFEGVYRNAQICVNGQKAWAWAYGYGEFTIDITPYLIEGENRLEVTADNSQMPNSRWYTGAGIYRPVWLLTGGKTHFAAHGLKIDTVSINPPIIKVTTEQTDGEVTVQILDGDQIIAEGVPGEITIPDGKLWCGDEPNLYTCRAELKVDGRTVDFIEATFGIRKITWDKNGLYINGKSIKLRGGCVHHDNGILGACALREAEWRKVRMMKEAGFNAIRSSHNPCSRDILDACDHYGVYMMDESWDMWFQRKNKYDYGAQFMDHWEEDLRGIVNKDYNHPSVILYSVCNEVSEPVLPEGVEMAGKLTAYLHELDASRPVTGGFNPMLMYMRKKSGMTQYAEEAAKAEPMNSSLMFNMMASMVGSGMVKSAGTKGVDQLMAALVDKVDITGYNYATARYERDTRLFPGKLCIGTETFPYQIVSNWRLVEKLPSLIGDFMWTAWDYLGEAGIGAWAYTPDGRSFTKPYPWLLGDTGALDILGDPNAEMFMAQAAWGLLNDEPKIAVQPVNHPGVRPAKQSWRGTNAIPSWSWKGCDGNKAVIEVYSGAHSVELKLNGKRLGKKRLKDCCAVFKTRYQPGTLEATAYDAAGKALGTDALCSAQNPELHLFVEKAEIPASNIRYVRIQIGDGKTVEFNADRKVKLAVQNGELLGFGSANPRTEESFLDGEYTTYYGNALAVIRCGKNTVVTADDGQQKIVLEM